MPELTPAQRRAGGDDRPLATWRVDPDRYGTATTDPLGREGEGWHIGDSRLPVLDKGWTRDPKTGRAVPPAKTNE